MSAELLYDHPKKFVRVARGQVLASHIKVLKTTQNEVCAEDRNAQDAVSALEKIAKDYGANGVVDVHVEERWVRGRLYEAWGKPAVLGVVVSAGENERTFVKNLKEPPAPAQTTFQKSAKSRRMFEIYLLIAVLLIAVYFLNETFGWGLFNF